MGRGIGLGLASAYGIIKNHGGIINAYSKEGKGTTFNVYIPASEKKAFEEEVVAEEIAKGTGNILLVDDEKIIIDAAKELIELLGYRVFTAVSGEEALKVFEKNNDIIDLVILDMIMPALSGSETFDRLKAVDPHVKVLLSSGYSINGQAMEIINRGCNGFIQKPFNMIQISQKIREILAKGKRLNSIIDM
jgi:CheY-like chemotaxis protein